MDAGAQLQPLAKRVPSLALTESGWFAKYAHAAIYVCIRLYSLPADAVPPRREYTKSRRSYTAPNMGHDLVPSEVRVSGDRSDLQVSVSRGLDEHQP